MALSNPRYKILPLRGAYTALNAEVANIAEGEICYATDQDQYYQKEGGVLVAVGATKAQGTLADSAIQPGDNVSELTNDAGYITSAGVPGTTDDLAEGTTNLYSQWDNVTGGINYADGNVGVGTTSPSEALDVNGTVKIGNTKLYSSGSGGTFDLRFQAYSGGFFDRVTITGAGNVGIGTTSPNKPLHIYSGSSDSEIRLQTNSGTEQNSYITLRESSGDLDFYTVASGTNMKFHTVNAERMRIDSLGRVGIGCTPASGLQLKRATPELSLQPTADTQTGYITFINSASSTRGAVEYSYASDYMAFKSASSEQMRIDSSGRLLVGSSTSPSAGGGQYAKIVAVGNTASDAGDGRIVLGRGLAAAGMSDDIDIGGIYFTDNTGETFATISAQVDGTPASGAHPGRLLFSTTAEGASGTTERMRIDTAGNVGIGTTPEAWESGQFFALQIGKGGAIYGRAAGDEDRNGFVSNCYHSASGWQYIASSAHATRYDQSDGNHIWYYAGTGTADASVSFSEAMRIDNNGNVGIGTATPGNWNPNADNLVVGTTSGDNGITIASGTSNQSSLFFSDGTSGQDQYVGYLQYLHFNDSFVVGTQGGTRMAIDSSGNVGIGTTSPTFLGSGFKEVIVSGETEGAGLMLQDADGNVQAGLFTSDISNAAVVRTVTNHPLVFRTNNLERMRIDSDGNVGIGGSPTNTASTKTFEIIDSTTPRALFNCTGTGGRQYGWYTSVDGQFAVYDYTAGSERLRIDSSGSVGIGTTSITAFGPTLQVSGSDPAFLIEDTQSAVDYFGTNIGSGLVTNWYDDAASWRIGTASSISGGSYTERMRINSSGNLYLNSPTTQNFETGVALYADGKVASYTNDTVSGSDQKIYVYNGDTASYKASINSDGGAFFSNDVLIGTTSNLSQTAELRVYSSGACAQELVGSNGTYTAWSSGPNSTSAVTRGYIGTANQLVASGSVNDFAIRAQNELVFTTNGNTERMRIDGSGRVGIGNTVMSSFTANGADDLAVGSGSGHAGITVYSGTSSQGSITFADGTSGSDAYRGAIEYYHATDSLSFRTASTVNRMVIDGSGNVTIGGNTVWHAGNDGSGSGLDADNLDGFTWDSSGKNIRASEYYADGWFRNYDTDEGLYNEANTMYWYSTSNTSWRNRSNQSTVNIAFATSGNTTRGYVYANDSSEIGFLNDQGSWSFRCDNSGNVTATANVTAYSDIRLKSDIEPIKNALDKVEQINGVTYTRIDSGERQTGLIAQEVEKVLPEAVMDGEEYKSVAYGNLAGLLVEAVKELREEVRELKAEIKTLREERS